MSKHITNWSVQHNGKEFPAGKTITIDNEEQAAVLVAAGAIGAAVSEKKKDPPKDPPKTGGKASEKAGGTGKEDPRKDPAKTGAAK